MSSIEITTEQAAVLAAGGPSADALARELRATAQREADVTGRTCELYHPEGYVFDTREPRE